MSLKVSCRWFCSKMGDEKRCGEFNGGEGIIGVAIKSKGQHLLQLEVHNTKPIASPLK